ncbi:hypothetical protein [Thalassospira lohafexi]|uniref:Uncharacterized protein n=1 Tax=Thalassospira lohafexi TaxID=744227 RepID=A0A2N3L474_9PROT|nr:hypothetical protein [Thalassospira lohafexi]PKR57507.1 hypothetical protein COO92_16330 [Thalassospira lohafexi]
MTITYPLSLPAKPGVKAIRWREMTKVGVSVSPFTFQRQVQRGQGQAWAADITLPTIRDRAVVGEWQAFLLAMNGSQGFFAMGDPDNFGPLGVATGSPVIDGAGQTGPDIATTGWTVSTTGILKKGDRIGLGSGATARMHKVLEDVDSDSNGDATLSLWPRVVIAPSNGAPIELDNPQSMFWFPDGIPERDIDRLGDMTLTLRVMEHLV